MVASAAFALMAGFAVVSTACAQGQGQNAPSQEQERREGRGQRDPQQRIDHRISELTQSLQLSADQQSRIRTILNNERTQMEALRQKNGLQGPQGRVERPDGQRPDSAQRGERGRGFGGRNMPPEVKALHDQTEKQIEGVLNSTQLAKYRQLRQQREQEHQKHEGGERGQPGQRAS